MNGLPARRRLYLMRHGSVEYFPAGAAVDAEQVPLTPAGREQARAAGRLLGEGGQALDVVLHSGLPRTQQTAEEVVDSLPPGLRPVPGPRTDAFGLRQEPAFQELRAGPGGMSAVTSEDAFLAPWRGTPGAHVRWAGGESLGELLQRGVGALSGLLADPGWQVALVVAHGGMNRALLSWLLTGRTDAVLASFQQAPGCLNAIDVATGPADALVRVVNLSAHEPLQATLRHSSLEALWHQAREHAHGDRTGV